MTMFNEHRTLHSLTLVRVLTTIQWFIQNGQTGFVRVRAANTHKMDHLTHKPNNHFKLFELISYRIIINRWYNIIIQHSN